jgi:phospholipid transport system substrate-binding protein
MSRDRPGKGGIAMPKHHVRILVSLILAVSVWHAPGAWAGAPTDQLREGIDLVFTILRDPQMAGGANAAARRHAIVTAADQIFDFGEMAKRSLGSHWVMRTPAERDQFVALFTELVRRTYIARVDQFAAAEMAFQGESVDGTHASVRTTVPLGDGREMPLEYRMQHVGERWRVYDIDAGGISLVSSYRAQFNTVIRRASYEALVARLASPRRPQVSAPAGALPGSGRRVSGPVGTVIVSAPRSPRRVDGRRSRKERDRKRHRGQILDDPQHGLRLALDRVDRGHRANRIESAAAE